MSVVDPAGRTITFQGALDWVWQPYVTTVLTGTLHAMDAIPLISNRQGASTTFTLDDDGITVDGIITEFQGNSIRVVTQAALEFGVAVLLKELWFHIPNYHTFHGTPISREGGRTWDGRLMLDSGEWDITIDRLEEWRMGGNDGLADKTATNHAHAISHIGRLTKKNGETFALQQARDDILECLRLFLSFSLGAWTAPILLTGLDESGARVACDWRAGTVDPCVWRPSWYPWPAEGRILSEVWRGFLRLWGEWGPGLMVCLEWYVQANTTKSPATGVVLSQTALELLFWKILGEPVLRADKAIEKIRFSDTLRLLLNTCQIKVDIPESLTCLTSAAGDRNWADGPHVTSELRNTFVHGSKVAKAADADVDVVQEAWQLALWYIEVVLLRKMGYAGLISSRLVRGERASMP